MAGHKVRQFWALMPLTDVAPELGDPSPWGTIDSVHAIGQGIVGIGTARHGGLFVPHAQLHAIPQAWQDYAARFTGHAQYFEEDCASALVALSFPDLFAGSQRAALELLPQLDGGNLVGAL